MSTPDRSGPVRRVLFQVHLWVGVAAALYVLVVSVTGAALVFRIHLQRAAHPELLTASNAGPQADIATVLESVRQAYPHGLLAATGLVLWWTRVVAPRWRRRGAAEAALSGTPVGPAAEDVT